MNQQKRILSFLFPSVGNIVFLFLIFYLLFFRGQGLLDDGDTGYHIRAGEYILKTLTIPKHDIFSYHTPPLPWVAHEWLSEVIMGGIHKYLGLNGVVFFFSVLISSVFYLLFRFLRANNGNIIISTLLVFFAALTSSMHWLARPHIFSWLLMLIWYFILDGYQNRNRNFLYWLPLLMLFWVNLHGGFILGFLLAGVFLLGNLRNVIGPGEQEKNKHRKKARSLFFVIVSSLVISLINPIGYRILFFPSAVISNKYLMDNVIEFLSPNFHKPEIIIFEIFLLIAIITFAVSRKGLNLIEVFLFLVFTHMPLFSVRYVPLFPFIISPILIRHIEHLMQTRDGKILTKFKEKARAYGEMDQLSKGFSWLVLGALLVILKIHSGNFNFDFNEKMKPLQAVEFLKKETIKGNMFNNDEFGDVLIYRAFPQYRVFFDGRSDMYGNEMIKEYRKVMNFKPGWEEIFEKYKIQWVFFDNDSPFSRFLLSRNDWKLIYSDAVANIFVKNIPEYEYLIAKYKGVTPFIKKEEGEKTGGG